MLKTIGRGLVLFAASIIGVILLQSSSLYASASNRLAAYTEDSTTIKLAQVWTSPSNQLQQFGSQEQSGSFDQSPQEEPTQEQQPNYSEQPPAQPEQSTPNQQDADSYSQPQPDTLNQSPQPGSAPSQGNSGSSSDVQISPLQIIGFLLLVAVLGGIATWYNSKCLHCGKSFASHVIDKSFLGTDMNYSYDSKGRRQVHTRHRHLVSYKCSNCGGVWKREE